MNPVPRSDSYLNFASRVILAPSPPLWLPSTPILDYADPHD